MAKGDKVKLLTKMNVNGNILFEGTVGYITSFTDEVYGSHYPRYPIAKFGEVSVQLRHEEFYQKMN